LKAPVVASVPAASLGAALWVVLLLLLPQPASRDRVIAEAKAREMTFFICWILLLVLYHKPPLWGIDTDTKNTNLELSFNFPR
jgi:hypothetical protein